MYLHHQITLWLAIFLLQTTALQAQAKNPPREHLLKEQVARATNDTARVTSMLALSAYYMDSLQLHDVYKDRAVLLAGQALGLAKQTGNKTKQGDCNDLLSRIYERAGDQIKARNFEKAAVALYIADHNNLMTGIAWKQLAGYFSTDFNNELLERVRYTNLALQAFLKSGNKLKQGETYQELGDLQNMQDPGTALQNLKKGLAVYQSIHYKKLQGIYFMLNENYDTMGDYMQAINYGLLAVKAAEAVKDTSTQMATVYNHLAKTYYDMHHFDKAAYYYKYALKYAVSNHDNDAYTIIAFNYANAQMKLGRMAQALQLMQTVKNVKDNRLNAMLYTASLNAAIELKLKKLQDYYYSKAASSLRTLDVTDYIRGHVYAAMISYQLGRKRYEQAKKTVSDYETITRHSKLIGDVANIQHILFKLDSIKGNYLSAIRHSQMEKKLLDTLMNEQKNKSISQLEIEYETEKKEHELHIQTGHIQLLTKEGQLQQAKLEQAGFIRKVTFGGIVMLSMLLSLSYSRYRIKNKNNLRLKAQQAIINTKNTSLEALITDKDGLLWEKEWLLKEIHHRVKNNLQIVISLLSTQSVYLQNSEALDAIQESQHRMHSISLIHQKLYQSDNVASIDMNEYINELVEFLKESFHMRENLEITVEVEPISLDVAQAVPIGLILNEAITNAIKYAFQGRESGSIFIGLDEPEPGQLILTIEDNGRGLPEAFDLAKSESLGMSLMKGLCRQLQGELVLSGNKGVKLQIKIPKGALLEDVPFHAENKSLNAHYD